MVFLKLILLSWLAYSEQFQIFDGQTYNGLHYPKVWIVEWQDPGQPFHLEFQIYSKEKPIDVSGVVEKRGKQPIFNFAYDLSFRGERRCRRVPAPMSWGTEQELHYYLDRSHKSFDKIIVSTVKRDGLKPYFPNEYKNCVEISSTGLSTPSRVALSEQGIKKAPPPQSPHKQSSHTKRQPASQAKKIDSIKPSDKPGYKDKKGNLPGRRWWD
jgi:hypothetical protein